MKNSKKGILNFNASVKAQLMTDIIIFIPMLALALSGLLIQVNYHLNHNRNAFQHTEEARFFGNYQNPNNTQKAWGFNRSGWNTLHKFTSIAVSIGVVVHLILHNQWIRRHGRSGKKLNPSGKITHILIFIFAATFISGFLAWIFSIIDPIASKKIIEIHDKFGIILCIVFIFHLISHRKWIIFNMKKFI